MHMADALISPAVGGTFWLASAGLLAWCARKIRQTLDHRLVPLMGVLGAFVFAAQMLNFSIPGTGSSGHLGGGLLLAVLLGPHAAFLVMASILTVQALFFADGGLLALGCNIWNLGFYPSFVAYPLVYRTLCARGSWGRRWAAVFAALVALELGALSVAIQTSLSGISALPFRSFAALMLLIHLPIGLVEGIATTAVTAYVLRARPEALERPSSAASPSPVVPVLIALALIFGGILSWFASAHPDGLEWAVERLAGTAQLKAEHPVHAALEQMQTRTSFLPDYGFPVPAESEETTEGEAWPAIDPGTTVAGIVGSIMVLGVVALAGMMLRPRGAPAREVA